VLAALGDRLGLFTSLATDGPPTSDELAARTGSDERYVREWAVGLVAADYLQRDPVDDGHDDLRAGLEAFAAMAVPAGAGPVVATTACREDRARRELAELIAARYPDRIVHVVGDAAYVGERLRDVDGRISWTSRLKVTSVLHELPPPRTGRSGRPRTKGARSGTPADVAALATRANTWRTTQVRRYGRTDTVQITEKVCLWYGSFRGRTVRVILVCDDKPRTRGGDDRGYGLPLVTTDLKSSAEDLVARYASRWGIEQAFADARQIIGIGEARNRTRRAVERTVPFGLICFSVVTVWYALHGHAPDEVTGHRARARWYTTKTELSYDDMTVKLRRVIITARFRGPCPEQATPQETRAVLAAWPLQGHDQQKLRNTS
jgi:winged helix-turn-helix protein/DDE family transposase